MKALLISFVFASVAAQAAVKLDAGRGKTEFLAIGRPSALKVNGVGEGPTGTLSLKKAGTEYVLNGQAIMNLSTFDTQMELRNSHMKEKYLEVDKFRDATLTFKDVKVPAAVVDAGGEIKVTAPLNLHGVDAPVDVAIKLAPKEGDLSAESSFTVKLTDHGIAIPKFTVITIGNEIQVKTQTLVSKKDVSEGT